MKFFYILPESEADLEAFIMRVNDRIKINQAGIIFEPLTFKRLVCYNGISVYVLGLNTILPNILPGFFFRFIIGKALKKEIVKVKFLSCRKAVKIFMNSSGAL